MKIKSFINRWLECELITQDQATKMLADISDTQKDEGMHKFVAAVSIIGSILLGIGVILFIASNWWAMPKFTKIAILLGFTFGTHLIGYYLQFMKTSYPKIGASLILLSSIIFGASLFLIANIYHLKGNSHELVLIWLVGVIPLVYAYRSAPISALSSILFIVWMMMYFKFDYNPLGFYLLSGIVLFVFGGLHYCSDKFTTIAKTYRIIGLIFALFTLFLLSFQGLSTDNTMDALGSDNVLIVIVATIFAIVCSLIISHKQFKHIVMPVVQTSACLGLVAIVNFFMFIPSDSNIYPIVFNLAMFGIIMSMLYIGFTRDDLKLVNIGSAFLAILVLSRYFDFFWELMPRSIFFIIGGLMLLIGVFIFEQQKSIIRKRLKDNEKAN